MPISRHSTIGTLSAQMKLDVGAVSGSIGAALRTGIKSRILQDTRAYGIKSEDIQVQQFGDNIARILVVVSDTLTEAQKTHVRMASQRLLGRLSAKSGVLWLLANQGIT